VAFLGPSDFRGSAIAWEDLPRSGGQATYSGYLGFFDLPRSQVKALLPSGLWLAEGRAGSLKFHPVLMMFGQQAQTGAFDNRGGTFFPYGPDYQEVILLVPFVVGPGFSDPRRWYNFALHMFLDNPQAVWGGNTYYGYSKEFSSLDVFLGSPGSAQVFRGASPLLHADFIRTGPDYRGEQTPISQFDDFLQILNFPVVGQLENGAFICSHPALRFGQASSATADIHVHFDSSISDRADWRGLGNLRSVPGGALLIQNVIWQIEYPPVSADCLR
jgi:hypothetical protein